MSLMTTLRSASSCSDSRAAALQAAKKVSTAVVAVGVRVRGVIVIGLLGCSAVQHPRRQRNHARPEKALVSGVVAGRDALGLLEAQPAAAAVLAVQGVEQERDVVAGVEAVEDATGEPVRAVLEHRDALRPVVPVHARELVEAVVGLAAE